MMPYEDRQEKTGRAGPGFCGWDDCPAPVRELVLSILARYRDIIADNLLGFYLHGSLAMGCFSPSVSDVDFLAIVRRPLGIAQKKAVISFLLSQSESRPVADVEMSIVREECLRDFVYPTPFELHYSIDHYQRYRNGQVDFSVQACDEDLAAHFVIARRFGVCLHGPPAGEMFPEIPEDAYVRSLVADAEWAGQRAEEAPDYAILNLCRVLAFLREDRITSKKEGAEWGLEHLPREFAPLIKGALGRYRDAGSGTAPDIDLLKDFVGYVREEVGSLRGKSTDRYRGVPVTRKAEMKKEGDQ